jgi:membrane fusion protein, multidrug efflux system
MVNLRKQSFALHHVDTWKTDRMSPNDEAKVTDILMRLLFLFVSMLFACGSGCSKKPAGSGGDGAGAFAVQVVAVEAKRQPISETLALVGNITANEIVEIKSEAEGVVEQINFNEGAKVEKGALLLKLDETKFAASLSQAEANYKLAKANFDRSKQLADNKLISQQEFEQTASSFAVGEAAVEWMRRQLKDARIHAPFSGITGARMVAPGQVVSRNTTLTWLVDLDQVKIEVKVPERYLSQIQIGRPLEFKVAAFPEETFGGEVYFVSPQLDENTRTALVKARIVNPGLRLKGGMFASLELTLQHKSEGLVIPEPALMSNGDSFMVFAIDGQSNAVAKPIKIGLRLAGKAEVLSGLSPGERVVVEGHQKLRPGAPVKLAPPEAAAPYLN